MRKKTQSKNEHPNILWLFNDGPGQQFYRHVSTAIKNAGGNPVIFDYIKHFDVKDYDEKCAKQHFIATLTRDEIAAAIVNPSGKRRERILKEIHDISDKKLKEVIEKFIKDNKITGIFLPGDYFNYDVAPFHPEPKERPRYSKILLEIAKEQNIPLMGACGGLQAIAYAENIAIKRVDDMVSAEEAQNHLLTDKASMLQETVRREMVLKDTRLGNFLNDFHKKFGIASSNEASIYVPESHRAAVDNSWQNRLLIEQKGYKIDAISSDGIIQGIEHKSHPIIGFQGHPEVMAARKEPVSLNLIKHFLIDPARERMTSTNISLSDNTISR